MDEIIGDVLPHEDVAKRLRGMQTPSPSFAVETDVGKGEFVTESRLVEAMVLVGRIVEEVGLDYLPIFRRLEAEITRLRDEKELLRRAIAWAQRHEELAYNLAYIFTNSASADE
jgi:hypothetical protein